jgi:SAM-dependent methyltransferase
MAYSVRENLAGGARAPLPAIDWDEARCPLCDGPHWSPRLEAPDATAVGRRFLVVRCRDCGLSYTNPRPGPVSLHRLYPPPAPFAAPHRPRHHPAAERLAALLPGGGRLLDVGLGAPEMVAPLPGRGWDVTVLHPDRAVLDGVREAHGWAALVGGLPHPELPAAGTFDAITFWHTLGRCPAPLDVLREANRLLAPGGRLVVAAPNLDGLPARWCGPAWLGLDLPRQLVHFTPGTLRLLLARAGFRVRHLHTGRRTGWLRASAARAAALGSAGHGLLRWRPFASVAGSYARLLGRGDCLVAVAYRAEPPRGPASA